MSGDLQARKRKDKRRKKEDEGVPFQPNIPHITTTNNHSTNDDVNIHVHKEGGLGGGICAKLVFFVLFSALAVLIGLIITEHRGLTDVDVADTNSKFSQIFEGWTDPSIDHHEHDIEDIEEALAEEHDDHDEEEEEEAESNISEENDDHVEQDDDDERSNEEDEDDDDDEQLDEDDQQNTDEDAEDRSNENNDIDTAEDEDNDEENEVSREAPSYEEEESNEIEEVKDSEEEEEGADDDVGGDDDDGDDDGDDGDETAEDTNQVTGDVSSEHSAERDEDDQQDDDDDINRDDSYEENVDKSEEDVQQNILGENKLDESEEKAFDDVSEEKDADSGIEDDDENERLDEETKEDSAETLKVIDSEKHKGNDDIKDDKEHSKSDEVTPKRDPEDENVQESSGSTTQAANEAGGASKGQYEARQDIDEDAIKNNPANAVKHFEKILKKSPSSVWSVYGNALALNYLADQQRSNEILYKAIQLYVKLLKMTEVPDSLYKQAVEKTIKAMRFVGQYRNIIEVHKLAISRFPEEQKNYNELAVTYLTINRIEDARPVLKHVLQKWPNDGFALVHQGFILKTADNKLEEAVQYLRKGIATNDAGVTDGRFYFHLGDALERLGRHKEAMEVYEEGAHKKLFLSKYQRSLYNVQRLTGKPYWKENELPYNDLFRLLKQNWKKIKQEGLSALNGKGYFQDESENLRDTGEWKQFELFARGFKNTKNCMKTPVTCNVIDQIPEAKGCKRGQTKFSVMHPGTHVWPHCGPTNCRLRVHLGLKVPAGTFLRVADEIRSWKEGQIFIFDDSFEHEVWHNGTELRLVLIVDIWHPELTSSEKKHLSPI